MSTLSARECDPPKVHGCIILKTLTMMLKCGSLQVLESVLAVIKVLLIALHVFHGWMVRQKIMLQLSSHWVPIYICRFRLEEHHPLIKLQSIKCLKLATMSLLKNKRSLIVWQKWSGSVESKFLDYGALCSREHHNGGRNGDLTHMCPRPWLSGDREENLPHFPSSFLFASSPSLPSSNVCGFQ